MSNANFIDNLFGTHTAITDESVSYPAGTANKLFANYRFSTFLPIKAYNNKEKLYICEGETDNTDDYGVVFEITPRIVMGSRAADFMTELLSKLPENITLELCYLGSKNIVPIIENFKDLHRSDNRLAEKAIKNFTEFLMERTVENITPSMNAYVKNIRVLITARGKNRNQIVEFASTLKNTMSSNSFFPKIVDPNDLKRVFYELCNGEIDYYNIPAYNDKTPFGRQCVSKTTITKVHDETIEFNGKHWMALAPVMYPEHACIDDFGIKLGDYVSPAMNINQFKDTFLITTTYMKLNKSEMANVAKKQIAIDSQTFPKIFTKFWKKKGEALSIKEKIDNREPIILFDMTLLVSGKDKEAVHENATTIQSFWNKGGSSTSQIVLDKIFGCPHIAFLQSLPLGATKEHLYVTDNYWFNFANESAQFLPLEADWKGNTANILAISRRGQLAAIDFFDSPVAKNGYIVATSGAGKSVFLQYLAFYSFACGSQVYLIDIGGSYEKLCKILGGEYIEVDTENPLSFNPFTKVKTIEDLRDSMPFFQDFIYMLGASKSLEESQKDEKYVKSFLNDAILELYKTYGSDLELTNIKDYLFKQDNDRLTVFAQHLTNYCRGGVYGAFFAGPASVDLSNPFAVLEVGKVEEQADIRDAIIFVMIYHISQKVYVQGSIEQRVQVIVDEAHKFLGKNPRMDDFVDQAYRRFRKHNASILMATQGFDDIFNATTGGLSRAGQTIIANSPWKVFLKQTQTSINLLLKSGVFNFTQTEEEVIRSITTMKGEYSEFLLINPDEHKIPYRLVLDRFFYYMTTTDPADKALIANTMKQSDCPLEEAIDIIVQNEKQKRSA